MNVAWMDVGACKAPANDPEWWWPQSAEDANVSLAISICRTCEVQDKCLRYAIRARERDGIWGGTLPSERRRVEALERERHTGQASRRGNHVFEDTPEQILVRRQALLEATR